ncbi:DUF2460 domain-containing protein [Wolbachia endosymbiont of Pentidionis agamae]|uniref:DUF2460 domain-containing protein n=1 Tax=Wolbachia endosymbiont of Pentidionis agamae TaxID=3110435 RepID=UPI002FD0CDA6
MSFTEVRFPEDISYGSTGGPEFSTDIVTSSEQRNINWSIARSKYNIACGVKSNEQLLELITFFRARKGRAIGFRFKDWSDYKSCNQQIGVGNGKQKTFQLIKNYISGESEYNRIINKPVQGRVKVLLNNEENNEYSVKYSTGEIIFKKPPPNKTIITANFEFDVPVRFDTDHLHSSIDNYGSKSWNNIPLIEIKA